MNAKTSPWPLLLTVLLGGACKEPGTKDTGNPQDSGDSETDEPQDTGEPGDTADTGTPRPPSLDWELLFPPPGFWQADHLTVAPDRGLIWERDEDFFLNNFTVPQILVMPDGRFAMLATNMTAAEGRWILRSEDGLEWTPADDALFLPTDFPLDCGNRFEDGALLVESDGTQRLIMEGTQLNAEEDFTEWRVWCQATSTDGITFTPLDAYFYTGSETDDSLPSVPSVLHLSDWSTAIYYMGDLYNPAGEGNGLRIARWQPGDTAATPWITENILPTRQMDPMAVYLEGGGVRLYHTSNIPLMDEDGEMLGPGPGFADSTDGVGFQEAQRLILPVGNCAAPVGGECLLDPAYLRLADGTMILYFTLLNMVEGEQRVGIGRAFAVD